MIDAHVHVVESPLTLHKVSELKDMESPIQLIMMSSRKSEWDLIADFDKKPENSSLQHTIAFGIHPWFAHLHEERDIEEGLISRLLEFPNSIVGEIGVDKAATDHTTKELFNWERQVHVFTRQMEIAGDLQRPVSIHSVQTHGYILEYFSKLDKKCAPFAKSKEVFPCPPTIMLHSFAASKEIMKALVKLPHIGGRFYFSYSDTVNARSKNTVERISLTPDDRLLIESDVHNVEDVPLAMEKAVLLVSKAKNWTLPEVLQKTTRNALTFLRRV